jgi:dihydrofolate reductase
MSKIVINCAMTVDGLIESPAPPPYGWLVMEGESEQAQFDVFRDAAGMLLGRKNYEGFAGYWPSAAGDGRWADRLNPLPKWVASTTLHGPLEWNATLLEGDVAEQVRVLKAEVDGDLVSSGLGSFARFLVDHDLVDELLFFVNPSIRGAGERPFHGAAVELELLEARSFDSGVALLRYRPHATGSAR